MEGEEWGAWEAAREKGLENIAYKVGVRISAMQIEYNRTGNRTSNFFTSISTQITDVILYDTKPIKRERRREPEGEFCYVLLASPKDKARTVISEFIEQEVQKNALFQKKMVEKAMEEELKKMDTPNSTTAPITQSPPLVKKRADYAKRNSFGINLSLEGSDDEVGMGVEVLEFHWSFLPFTSGGIGVYPYFIGGYESLESEDISFGGSLYAGLVYPLTANNGGFNARLYTDFVFNINNSGRYIIGAGFDAGLALTWSGLGFDLRYRGVVYEEQYVNSLGIGFVIMFDDL
ncbi:MAG: hypothetical protein LBL06_04740 [Treponema sp.]|nr:hypothetical protein [Treponema sp.]